jgi:uncharacterized coiled-coil protein SlyX
MNDFTPRIINSLSATLLAIIPATGLTSCGSRVTTPSTVAQPTQVVVVPESGKKLQDEIDKLRSQLKPVTTFWNKLSILIDSTASTNSGKTNILTIEDVKKAILTSDSIPLEVAVGVICNESAEPLLRQKFGFKLAIPKDLFDPITPPIDQTEKGNIYYSKGRQKQYQNELAEYEEKVAKQRKQIANFQAELNKYHTEQLKLIENYLTKIKPILQAPKNCQSTMIHPVTDRINEFFEEPDPTSSLKVNKWLFAMTDGLDEKDKSAIKFTDPKVKTVIIYGANGVGVLGGTPHQKFESPKAAIDSLIGQIQKP